MANYQVSGVVTQLGVPVQRRVKAYKADKTDFNSLGEKVGGAVSRTDGVYSVPTGSYSGKTFVIAIDDETPPDYDPGGLDWITPELGPAPTFYYSRVLFDLPQAFWELDDTAPTTVALDASPAALHGAYENSPPLEVADTPYANSGNSVQFDGTSQAMVSPSVLSPVAGAGFTLEFAFKTPLADDQVLFASRAFVPPADNYLLVVVNKQGVVPALGVITLELDDGTTHEAVYNTVVQAISDNQWHHLVVIKSGLTIRLIYDGAELALNAGATVTGPAHNGASHVFAREPNSAPGEGFSGLFYSLPLWFSALTAETAKVHFYLLRRPSQPYLDLVLGDSPDRCYVLQEAAGDITALDLAGLDQHGDYIGATPGSTPIIPNEPTITSALFDAAGDRVEVDLPFSGTAPTTAFTIEVWFQTTRSAKSYITDRYGSTNRLALVLNEDAAGAESAGYIQCFISPSPGLVYRVTTTVAYPQVYNGFSHWLAVVYDHPDITILLDGEELATSGAITVATVLRVSGEPQHLGASLLLDAATRFDGNLSHFSVWDTALALNIVTSHYTQLWLNYIDTVVGDNPEAFWPLNDISAPLNDEMGNYSGLGVTGTPVFATPSIVPQDPSNECIDFNGDSYVTTFSGPIIYNRSTWTLEVWFIVDGFPGVSASAIGQGDFTGSNIAIFLQPGPDRVDCGVWTGTQWYFLPLNAEVGRLYYVVFTKDATGLKAYVNGALYDSDLATPNADTRTSFTIARIEDASATPFNGRMQHAAVYYSSLGQNQVIEHFRVGFHGGFLDAILMLTPTGVWPMSDQLNAVQAVEFSGNYLHGVYSDGALGGGPSQIPSESFQLSVGLQAANNSRVTVPQILSSSVATSAYTWMFWVQTTNTGQCYLLDRADQSLNLLQRMFVELNAVQAVADPNYLQVNHRGAGAGTYVSTSAPFNLLTDGEVHFIAVVFDTPFLDIYVDGILLQVDGKMPGPEIIHLNSLAQYIGARMDLLQAEKFVGQVSFAAAWDGVALAAEDIEGIYQDAGFSLIGTDYEAAVLALTPGGFWPLQESSPATIAYDISGNALDGTYDGSDGGGPALLRNERDASCAEVPLPGGAWVDVPNILVNPVPSYTWMIWFQTTSTGIPQWIGDTGNVSVGDDRFLIGINAKDGVGADGYITVYHQAASGHWVSSAQAYPEIYDGTPHYLCFIFDQPDIVFILDGKVIPTTGSFLSFGDIVLQPNMRFGATRYGAAQDGFIGQLSHAAVWDTPLSVAQARSVYLASGWGMLRAGYESAVLRLEPDSFWEMQEASPAATLVDSSGNGNDGTYDGVDGGGSSLLPNRSDLSSAVFTATNDALVVPNGFATGVPTTAYTFEFWFRTTKNTGRMFLWEKIGGSSVYRVILVLNASEDNVTLDAGKISVVQNSEFPDTWVSTVAAYPQIYDGNPHHLAFIYTEPNMTIVLDGAVLPVNHDFGSDIGILNDQPTAYIGRHKSDTSSQFVGEVSHYAAWFDRALSLTQVQDLYAAGGGT